MQTVEVGALKAQKHLGDRWLVAGGEMSDCLGRQTHSRNGILVGLPIRDVNHPFHGKTNTKKSKHQKCAKKTIQPEILLNRLGT